MPTNLELAVLDSLKVDENYLKEFDENINSLFRFYYYSTVRRKELLQMAEVLEEEFQQLGRMKNIRWISSRARALSILEKNFKTIIYDLESKSYSANDTGAKAKGFLKCLKHPKFLFHLHFMQDFVNVLRELSLLFQRDNLLACEILRHISDSCTKIDSLSITSGECINRLMNRLIVDEEKRVTYNEVVLDRPGGRHAEKIVHEPLAYLEFYNKVFNKIIEQSQDYIKNRFVSFEQSPLAEMNVLFDFKQWPKSYKTEKRWGVNEVTKLSQWYKSRGFITEEEQLLSVRQWPLFRERVSKLWQNKLSQVYFDMLIENKEDMKGMLLLLEIMVTISCSTAAVERGFPL